MGAPYIVVNALDACWDAINNWVGLQGAIKKKYQSDDDLKYLIRTGPSPSDIGRQCALVLKPVSFNINTRTNQGIDWPIAIQAQAYFETGATRQAWGVLEEIIHAIYASKPSPGGVNTPTYVANCAAIGSPPQGVVSIGVSEQKVSSSQPGSADLMLLVATATFVFKGKTNPFPLNQ